MPWARQTSGSCGGITGGARLARALLQTLPGRRLWYDELMRVIEARYEEGLLRPETPLALTPGERVALIVVRHPDPRRWNLEWLAKSGAEEDLALAEQGLGEWADALDAEDHH